MVKKGIIGEIPFVQTLRRTRETRVGGEGGIRWFNVLPSQLYEPRNQKVNGSSINVMINGELEMHLLLDTGAQITLLNEVACEQLKIKIKVKPTSLAVNGPSPSHNLNIVG